MNRNLHLANKPILVNRPAFFTVRQPRSLCPHLLHILQHHITMSVESLNARKQLAIVATGDQNLICVAYGSLEDWEWAAAEFVLLQSCNLILAA